MTDARLAAASRAIPRAVAVLAVIVGGLLVALPFGVLRWVAPAWHERAIRRAAQVWSRAALAACGIALEVRGSAFIRGGLLVANHVSWIDAIALGAACPGVFVAKAEVAGWPAIGLLATVVGTEFVQRCSFASAARGADRIGARLRRGDLVFLFPEGTTTTGEAVGVFRPRLFTPAVAHKALVQPVALRFSGPDAGRIPFVGEDAFLPHLLGVLRARGVRVHLEVGAPRPAFCDARALARALEVDVQALLDRARQDVPARAAAVRIPSQTVPRLAR